MGKPLPGSAETPPVPVDDNPFLPFLPFLCLSFAFATLVLMAIVRLRFLFNIEKNRPVPGQF